MKLILFIVFALVVLWCFFGCGGGYSVDQNKTHQIDTMPDSLRVKDTSFAKRMAASLNAVYPYSAKSMYMNKNGLMFYDSAFTIPTWDTVKYGRPDLKLNEVYKRKTGQ